MKRLLSVFLVLALIFPPQAFALQYVEERPEAIQSIQYHGVGAIYGFMGSDGGIRRMKVTGYAPNARGSGIIVTLERADQFIIVDFESENEFTFKPVQESDTSTPASTPTDSPNESAGADGSSFPSSLSIGLGSGIMAGLQTGIIESTGYAEQIQRAYAKIAELQKKMGADLMRIEEALVSLKKQAILVMLKASEPNSTPVLPEMPDDGAATRERIRYITQTGPSRGEPIRWLSRDDAFLERARAIESTLKAAPVRDEIDQTFHDISKRALIAADQNSFLENREAADFLLTIAKESADVLVGIDPFTGTVRSLYESITGKNLVTGKELSATERIFATLGIITAGYAIKTSKAFQILEGLSKKIAPRTMTTLRSVASFFRKTGNGFELVGEASSIRKVNFRSNVDPSWGLTPKHLKKHFFGESKYALNKIDPAGTPDSWMQNLTDLIQRPASKTLDNGAIDIHGIFSKADGSGTFDMGVRLWPNADGTFELITVLTKQNGV